MTERGAVGKWLVVLLLTLAYTASYVDRQILSLFIDPIKIDLKLSDTQVSLLTGLAFMVLYTGSAVPIAYISDAIPRIVVVRVGVVLWSMMTAACGLASSFFGLFAARMGVGLGEATLSPAAYALISDLFQARNLAAALSVYAVGGALGSGAGLAFGALVTQHLSRASPGWLHPWQLAFIVVSIPSFAIALLLMLVREPNPEPTPRPAKIRAAPLSRFTEWGVFWPIVLGTSFAAIETNAFLTWTPSFLERVLGWSVPQVGEVLGAVVVGFGAVGMLAGGALAVWLRRRGWRAANMIVATGALVLVAPALIGLFLSRSEATVVPLLGLSSFLLSMPVSVIPAALNEMAAREVRARVSAIFMLVVNTVGIGSGSTLVALVTDYGFHDPLKVGDSLAIISALVLPFAAIVFLFNLPRYATVVSRTELSGAVIGAT